jgi:hypothetical protein
MPAKLRKYEEEKTEPVDPLESYIRPMTSASFDFIVHLTIAGGVSFGVNELLSLTDLRNLGVLQIIQPCSISKADTFPRVSDRVLRAWSQLDAPGAFPVLRVLRIYGNDFTTSESLKYVAKFPALVLYDVAGRSEDWRRRDTKENLDWDIRKHGMDGSVLEEQYIEPFASISLGHADRLDLNRYSRAGFLESFGTYCTFARASPSSKIESKKRATQPTSAAPSGRPQPRSKKLKGMQDMLAQFST